MEDYVRKVEEVMNHDTLLPHGKAAAVAIWFMAIHPFSDGNGRMGRILCNWALMKCGYPFTLALCSTRPQVIPLSCLPLYLPPNSIHHLPYAPIDTPIKSPSRMPSHHPPSHLQQRNPPSTHNPVLITH